MDNYGKIRALPFFSMVHAILPSCPSVTIKDVIHLTVKECQPLLEPITLLLRVVVPWNLLVI